MKGRRELADMEASVKNLEALIVQRRRLITAIMQEAGMAFEMPHA